MNAMIFQNARGIRTPYISGSVSEKLGTGKDRNLHFVLARVAERVVFEGEPDRRIESLHLRRRVGDVHGVFVATLRGLLVAPTRILAPSHMAAAKFWRVAVALIHDLLRLGYARIPLPTDACAL